MKTLDFVLGGTRQRVYFDRDGNVFVDYLDWLDYVSQGLWKSEKVKTCASIRKQQPPDMTWNDREVFLESSLFSRIGDESFPMDEYCVSVIPAVRRAIIADERADALELVRNLAAAGIGGNKEGQAAK